MHLESDRHLYRQTPCTIYFRDDQYICLNLIFPAACVAKKAVSTILVGHTPHLAVRGAGVGGVTSPEGGNIQMYNTVCIFSRAPCAAAVSAPEVHQVSEHDLRGNEALHQRNGS